MRSVTVAGSVVFPVFSLFFSFSFFLPAEAAGAVGEGKRNEIEMDCMHMFHYFMQDLV